MNIAFRVDVSSQLGNGHIQRCLTLALALKALGGTCYFVLQPLAGAFTAPITNAGFEVFFLPKMGVSQLDDASACLNIGEQIKQKTNISVGFWVVDVYALDATWHRRMRNSERGLLVIDDLANRQYDADFILDQTPGRQSRDYEPLSNTASQFLMGVHYALLRNDFWQLRNDARDKRQRQEKHNNILVSLGGTDFHNQTAAIFQELIKLPDFAGMNITLVLASNAPHLGEVQQLVKHFANIKLRIDVNTMAQLLIEQDIAIGAAGVSALERACLGLPTLQFITAENQQNLAAVLGESGCVHNLGICNESTIALIPQLIEQLRNDQNLYSAMSDQGFALCDGRGAEKVAAKISHYLNYPTSARELA